jgi:phytoene dehydrogenase-like protein
LIYDLIVIGDDLSSHVAAAVASCKGISTVLLSEIGIGEEICLTDDLVFNVDPTPMTGFDADQAGTSLLAELDMPSFERETLLLNPAYQIILPEHRLDFFNDKESLVNEMVREFPELAAEINSFYDAVVKNSAVIDKWLHDHPLIRPNSIKDYIDYLKLTPYLINYKLNNNKLKWIMSRNASFKKVMEAQKALLSFKTKDPDSIFSHFQYAAPLRGVHYFSQGKQGLLNSLIKKIESTSGLYLNNCEVLSIKKDHLIEVTYNDKDSVATKIASNNLIVSTKWQNMHLLLERKKKFNLDDLIRPIKISYYPFTIHLGVRQKSIPEKMARHVAVISDVNKNIYDDNLIILESSMHKNEKTISATKSLLSATVFLPDDQMTWSKENLTANARSIIERLEYFLPFLKENIEFFDIKESINISQKQRVVVNPKYQLKNSFFSGFAAKSNKTKFGNIYLTGASLLTDAGFEGEIISGMNAAARVADKRK